VKPKKTKFRKFQKHVSLPQVRRGGVRASQHGAMPKSLMFYGAASASNGCRYRRFVLVFNGVPTRITAQQIQTLEQNIARFLKILGKAKTNYKVWTRVFPYVAGVSRKPTEVRMGKGKGSVDFWSTRVISGQPMFELDGLEEEVVRDVARFLSTKTHYQLQVCR